MARSPYVYTPLPPGAFIRLFTLQPGEQHDDVEISLQTVALDNCPSYTAMSYVWGLVSNGIDIVCDGQSTVIQENLHHALKALRHTSTAKLLWADAICINQASDIREKMHQVGLMGKIYEQATEVVIWLGLDSSSTADNAFRLATEIATHNCPFIPRKQVVIPPRAEVDDAMGWSELVDIAAPDALAHFTGNETERWNNLSAVYNLPWFTRVWVIAEAGLSAHTTARCGSSTIPWPQLAEAAMMILQKAKALAGHFIMIYGVARCSSLYWAFSSLGRRSTFVDILNYTSNYEASNKLDYVYALLSHPAAQTPGGTPVMEPDYSLTPDEMSARLTNSILREYGSLQLLSAVQREEPAEVDQDLLPSFVPRWYAPAPAQMLGQQSARMVQFQTTLKEPPRFRLSSSSTELRIAGVRFDSVLRSTTQILKQMWRGSEVDRRIPLMSLSGLMEDHQEAVNSRYSSTDKRVDAFFQTMTCGRPNAKNLTGAFAAYAQRCGFQSGLPELSLGDQPSTGNEGDFIWAAENYTHRRRPFITQQGHLGMGPPAMQQNDIVCVLFGCNVPYVLRTSSSNRYRLVGECYLYGIMNGEVIQAWQAGQLEETEFAIH